jgi:uncharacterized iron-regulated protein
VGWTFLLLAAHTLGAPQVSPAPVPPPNHPSTDAVILVSYVPERVYDASAGRFTDFEVMLAEIARADVVLVGEQHDDRNTHRLELALLEGLMRRRVGLAVALEMFERDTQTSLAAYLSESLSEKEFLESARPWPRYASDYRPLVEFARAHGWPVIASNVPRRIAALIARDGLQAVDSLSETDRGFVARSIECPRDDYRTRFIETMNEHPAPGVEKLSQPEREAMNDRYYFAQCVKDETMAEAIVSVRTAPERPLVVHFNGAFHTDFRAGVVPRVERRLDEGRVVVLSILPVEGLDTLDPNDDDRTRADYLIYTLKPQKSPHSRD